MAFVLPAAVHWNSPDVPAAGVVLRVVLVSGRELPEVHLSSSQTVLDAKCSLEVSAATPVRYQRLVLDNRELQDDRTLVEEGLADETPPLQLVCVSPAKPSVLGSSQHADSMLVRYLLQCGADPSEIGADGLPEVHAAARHGNNEIFQLLLRDTDSIGINRADEDGRTLLHLASLCGQPEMCQSLVFGSSFSCSNQVDAMGWTALHCAALNGHRDVCMVILACPDFTGSNWPDCFGRTALELALCNGHTWLPEIMGHGHR